MTERYSDEKRKALFICNAGIIAALYVVLTWLTSLVGLSSGVIQYRLSEIMMILPLLPVIGPASVIGLTISCALANQLTGCIIWDVIFGTLATLIGTIGTRLLRKFPAPVALLPPVLSNALVVPFVLRYAYHFEGTIPYFILTVGIGELVMVEICGLLLLKPLRSRLMKVLKKRGRDTDE